MKPVLNFHYCLLPIAYCLARLHNVGYQLLTRLHNRRRLFVEMVCDGLQDYLLEVWGDGDRRAIPELEVTTVVFYEFVYIIKIDKMRLVYTDESRAGQHCLVFLDRAGDHDVFSAGKMEMCVITVSLSPDDVTDGYQLQGIGGAEDDSFQHLLTCHVLVQCLQLELFLIMVDNLPGFGYRQSKLVNVNWFEDVVERTYLYCIKCILLVSGNENGPETNG